MGILSLFDSLHRWSPAASEQVTGAQIFIWTMGNCSGPKTRRSFLSFFFFYIFIWQCLEVDLSRQWGLLSPRLCTKMGAIRNSPCRCSHDSMRALCVSLRAVVSLSIHVIHRRGRPSYSGWRSAFTHPTRTKDLFLTRRYKAFHPQIWLSFKFAIPLSPRPLYMSDCTSAKCNFRANLITFHSN